MSRWLVLFALGGALASFGGFVSMADASCLSEAYGRCTQAYQTTRTTCKTQRTTRRPACVSLRTNALKRCKQTRTAVKCKRKRVSSSKKDACKQLGQLTIASCLKADSGCSAPLQACQRRCFKTCKVCTISHVMPCVQACKRKFRHCASQQGDQKRRCQRKGKHRERWCVRRASLHHYRASYRCNERRWLAYVSCTWRAYDLQRTCNEGHFDTYIRCLRQARTDRELCRERARTQCRK